MPPLPPEPIPAERLLRTLETPELSAQPAASWTQGSSCFLSVDMREAEGIPYVRSTLLLRSEDAGRTWARAGELEGSFDAVFVSATGASWLWATWMIEGTFSSLYRLDGGALVPATGLDEAVRAKDGCCFTRIEAAHFADDQRGIVQVSGLGPEGDDTAWFGTRDGGRRWVYLGPTPTRGWARLLSEASRAGPGCAAVPPRDR